MLIFMGQGKYHLHIPYLPLILSAYKLILSSFHLWLYVVPHPEPTKTTVVTEDIPVGPLMMS